MALIGQIRKHGTILVGAIAVAVAGFMLMDSFNGKGPGGGGGMFSDPNNIGTINGRKVDYQQLAKLEQMMYGNQSSLGSKGQIWEMLVDEETVKKEAAALGLTVSKEELKDLMFGTNLSPVMQGTFAGPDGQVDRKRLDEIKAAIDKNEIPNPQFREYWAFQEQQVIKERLRTKILNLVTKGIYTPSWMAEMSQGEQASKVDFKYVRIPFAAISDEEAKMTDADYNAYIAANAAQYKQDEETRKMDFVSFEVKATAADSAKAKNDIATLIEGFKASKNDSTFLMANKGGFSNGFIKKAQLPAEIATQLLTGDIGTVVGPYLENGAYKVSKVIGKRIVPDSVKARHILVQGAGAKKTIDSLKALIETKKERFEDLAKKFSKDPGSGAKGGDLGYFAQGMMVPAFNDVCFYKEPGALYPVETQFGVHLIDIVNQKYKDRESGVKTATISQNVEPSEETTRAAYLKAQEFASRNRNIDEMAKAAALAGVKLDETPPVKQNDYFVGALGGDQTTRDMVKFAYAAKQGEVSPNVFIFRDAQRSFESKYVVAGVRTVIPAGLPPIDAVRDQIAVPARNFKRAQILKSKVTTKDLDAIAKQFSAQVDVASDVAFNQPMVQGLGNEPTVIGAMFSKNVNDVTEPIAGLGGVYVAQLTNKVAAPAGTVTIDPAAKKGMVQATISSIQSGLFSSLKKKMNITDNRSKFF
jgi:peptidyl-prolyl cis-trans isomerase D